MPQLGPNFYEPTVIANMHMKMQLATEETFGPVAGLFPFGSEKEVVEMANGSDVGLAAYFFSKEIQRIYRVAEALEVGMIGINTGLISDVAAPSVFLLVILGSSLISLRFGGVKLSGFGREGSKYGISEYQVVAHFHSWVEYHD